MNKFIEKRFLLSFLVLSLGLLLSCQGTNSGATSSGGNSSGTPGENVNCGNSEVIFCSGFEEGSFDIWDDWDGNTDTYTNQLVEDAGPFNTSGNHVLQLRVHEGRGTADVVKVLPSSHDKLYARWYQKWEEGFDFTVGNHGGGLHAGDRSLLGHSDDQPNGEDWYSTWFEPSGETLNLYSYYRGMYQDCVDPNGSCWGDHFPCWMDEGNYCEKPEHRETLMPPTPVTNQWYCVEIMLDGGTPVQSDDQADGVQNMWVDGEEFGPFEDLWHRRTSDLKINVLWLSLFHHGEHSVPGTQLDEVAVSTSRIGCGELDLTD